MTSKKDLVRQTILALLLAGIVLAGCGEAPESEPPSVGTTPESMSNPTMESFSAGGFHYGEAAQWPDYIPADIPLLAGEISTVMEAPGSHVRLFYENVSMEQVLEYLDLLESMGFTLEYRVLVQEGFPDRSEEKKRRSEFDDVEITKNEYHMNITYGPNPRYDIYTSGFQEEAVAATTLQWPADLPASVPQVPNCPLQTIYPADFEGYNLTCKKEADNVEEAYLQLLLSSGFEEKDGTQLQNHVIVMTVYENDEAIVLPSVGFSPTFFSIQVFQKIDLEPIPWPEELEKVVPQPEQCEISTVLPVSPGKYLISCSGTDESVLPDYLSLLAGIGFEETVKFTDENDKILAVTMEIETAKVQLMNSGLDLSITIEVKDGQP